MKYKVGVVSGKFRLLHVGHKEVLLKASLESIEQLIVIIHVNEKYKRYSTVEELEKSISEILSSTDKQCKIIATDKIFETIGEWEEYVMNIIGHTSILMFNSKEDYINVKLDNKYIKCITSNDVSVSNIEDDILNNVYVAEEFIKYIKKI